MNFTYDVISGKCHGLVPVSTSKSYEVEWFKAAAIVNKGELGSKDKASREVSHLDLSLLSL